MTIMPSFENKIYPEIHGVDPEEHREKYRTYAKSSI
jgi:hypothetical protein